MLSSADADLVRRDPLIPGLALALDPDAFVAALRSAAPEVDLRAAHITYVRYKPLAHCRVAYRLDVAGVVVDLDVRACRPQDLDRWIEGHDLVQAPGAGPLGPECLVLKQCAVLVATFPNDLRLRVVQELVDSADRQRVLRELLPSRPDVWQGELRGLRYRPERRYVAELRVAGGPRAILKSYAGKAYTRGRRNAQAFRSRAGLRIARLLGCSDSRRLLAFEWLSGRLLRNLCCAPEIDVSAITAVGAALAELHAQEAEASGLVSMAVEIGFICPRLARRATVLARGLAAELTGAEATYRPVHGDFSANQVLVGEQHVAIVDLDSACYGDPADDLGNFIAQAERHALRGELPPGRVESIRAALLAGYALGNPLLPRRIDLYTAVKLLRATRFPFRAREEDWPQHTESLLERAEAVLANE